MKIIVMSEEMGIIWYTANNFMYKEIHVVVYGLSSKQFDNSTEANEYYKNCLDHYWESN